MRHKDISTTHRRADYWPNPAERDAVAAAFGRVPIRVPICAHP